MKKTFTLIIIALFLIPVAFAAYGPGDATPTPTADGDDSSTTGSSADSSGASGGGGMSCPLGQSVVNGKCVDKEEVEETISEEDTTGLEELFEEEQTTAQITGETTELETEKSSFDFLEMMKGVSWFYLVAAAAFLVILIGIFIMLHFRRKKRGF